MTASRLDGEDLATNCAMYVHLAACKAGLTDQAATGVAVEVIDALRKTFGGECLYFPKGGLSRDQRAAEVHALWRKGVPLRDIANQMECTLHYIYQLIARERRRLAATRTAGGPQSQ